MEHACGEGFLAVFLHLLRDPAHWAFELLVSVVFLGIETVIFWPLIRRIRSHHRDDDKDISSLKNDVEQLRDQLSRLSVAQRESDQSDRPPPS